MLLLKILLSSPPQTVPRNLLEMSALITQGNPSTSSSKFSPKIPPKMPLRTPTKFLAVSGFYHWNLFCECSRNSQCFTL